MAFSSNFMRQFALVSFLFFTATRCNPQGDPLGIVNRALECFNDHYVYDSCQEDYRLKAQGILHVPREATEEYCTGPCLAETKLVLKCIDDILFNFRFYNGASIKAVSESLAEGCGHTGRRGDFGVLEGLGVEGYGDYYGHGNKLVMMPITLLIILVSCILLLWV